MPMNNDVIQLNPKQKEAVTYNDGPLLIIAGAGTGKTRVLVEKIKHLLHEKITTPDKILALTFTEKAAFEMEERVDQALPYGYFQMSISTFHAFADRVLKEDAHHVGLSPSYRLITEAEAIIFLRKHLFKFNLEYFRPLGNPHKFLSGLLQHFSRLKDEDISPKEYDGWLQKKIKNKELASEEEKKYIELSEAYTLYQNLKNKEGLADFSDLVFNAATLFRTRPHILKKYRKQFKYILVDEFQDTNIAQYNLIKLLAPPEGNSFLTVVGDDSQAIYKFRGASVSNILNFMNDYKNAKQVTLNSNYRSYQSILNASYQLIKHNDPDTLEAKLGISKKLAAENRGGREEAVRFHLADSVMDEADYVAQVIAQKKSDAQYSDFAILVRANNHAIPFMQAMNRKGIPYQFLGPNQLFKQPEVKDLVAYLKFLSDLDDSPALYRVLTMSLFSIDHKDISLLLAFTRKTALSLFLTTEIYLSFFYEDFSKPEYAPYKKYLPLVSQDTREKLHKLFVMINKHLSRVRKESAGQILFSFLQDTGYLNSIVTYKTVKEEQHAINISNFFNRLKVYESEHEDASVYAVVDYINMSMELGDSPLVAKTDVASFDAVNVLTVHSAKGLEFPYVFLVNLSSGRFPPYEKREMIPIPQELIKEILPTGDYHLEEERRLFYVGMTRAMKEVYLSASLFYTDGKRQRKVSPFVAEAIGEESLKKYESLKKEEKIQLSIFDFKKPEEPTSKFEVTNNNFSFSQLSAYATCPLQYKYQFILKIPTPPSSAATFGESIHKTLQRFYQEFTQNREIDKDRLINLYHENWIPVGFLSQSHQKKMMKEGEKMLSSFYDTFHTKNIRIVDLEKLFKIKLEGELFVTGKIDRVDSVSGNGLEIVDYKTGNMPDKKELAKSLQLSIYALAATNAGLYNKKLAEVTLTFYYLKDLKKVSMTRTPEEMEEMKKQVVKTVTEIKKGVFKPRVGPWCEFCSFKMICEAWQ